MTEDRENFLKKIVGSKKANEVKEDVEQATEKLDEMKIQRKDDSEAVVDEKESTEEMVMTIAAQVAELEGVDVSPEEIAEVIVAGIATAEVEEERQDEDEETVAEPAEETEDEEDKQLTQYQNVFLDMVTAQGDMAKDVEAAKALVPIVEELKAEIAKQTEKIAALEAKYAGRPKQASKSDETVLNEDEIAEQMKNVTGEVKIVAGVPVNAQEYEKIQKDQKNSR